MPKLTPRTVALATLVHLYATHADQLDEPGSNSTRQALVVVLVEEVLNLSEQLASAVEPGLSELLHALRDLPPKLVDEFRRRLLGATEVDDLWELMGGLSELLHPTEDLEPAPIDRSSVLGLFIRRAHLAFQSATFEELCTLISHLGEWVAAANDPSAAATSRDASPPPWAHLVPHDQLEQHVQTLVRQLDECSSELTPKTVAPQVGAAATCPPPARSAPPRTRAAAHPDACPCHPLTPRVASSQVEQLLELAPHVPQVHYLHMLTHLHAKEHEQALEAFHRYFDKVRAASAPAAAPATAAAPKESMRALTQWASLNLARLLLALGHRNDALWAIQESITAAQQVEDHVCLAYAMLWMYHAQAGAPRPRDPAADVCGDDPLPPPPPSDETAPPELGSTDPKRQQALLQRCLARAHELKLPELVTLASEALALRTIDAASAPADRAAQPVTGSAVPEPVLSVGRAPPLPPAPLVLPGALPCMPPAQPPPLHAWEALRCGADALSGTAQLVRACAWERFGDTRLASLAASLQLRFHRPAGAEPLPSPYDPTHRSLSFGFNGVRATQADRLLAACKLAVLEMPQLGEAAALRSLLAIRALCLDSPPLRAVWMLHTGEVLLRGCILRSETIRLSELLVMQRKLVEEIDGPSDVTWPAELELLLMKGERYECLCEADKMTRRRPSGRGAGAASPKPLLLLYEARAHAAGGQPINALPHALTALTLADEGALRGLHAAATLQLAEVQLLLDPLRALEALHRVRAQIMRAGSAREAAQLQLLEAQARLNLLPEFDKKAPPTLQQFQPRILPALQDAASGFAKLRCHLDVADVLYIRARIWDTLGAEKERDRDCRLGAAAEEEARKAENRWSGRLLHWGEEGALEYHLEQLERFDAAAAELYAEL